ncbi:hypothetical protein M0D21_22820 [Aquimarina sp. D1M17]|uniref:hypothetical protein n=1 Tax=Aquimarina acroporae TaxID=2937283 RepID=UPI0020BFA8AB|nr:hypothetical protein [Aquimarina acroporae]MCK8524424.1 hypothetical protein [Aquimarina acroporae]
MNTKKKLSLKKMNVAELNTVKGGFAGGTNGGTFSCPSNFTGLPGSGLPTTATRIPTNIFH